MSLPIDRLRRAVRAHARRVRLRVTPRAVALDGAGAGDRHRGAFSRWRSRPRRAVLLPSLVPALVAAAARHAHEPRARLGAWRRGTASPPCSCGRAPVTRSSSRYVVASDRRRPRARSSSSTSLQVLTTALVVDARARRDDGAREHRAARRRRRSRACRRRPTRRAAMDGADRLVWLASLGVTLLYPRVRRRRAHAPSRAQRARARRHAPPARTLAPASHRRPRVAAGRVRAGSRAPRRSSSKPTA